MSTKTWIGASLNLPQVDTITMAGTGDWVAGDTIKLTIASIDLILTVGSLVTDAQVATSLYQALTGTAFTDTTATFTINTASAGVSALPPQFQEWDVSVSSNIVTLKGKSGTTPPGITGRYWVLAVDQTVSGDETASESTATTATSQFHWNQADNWSSNGVPTDTDDIVFDRGDVDVRYLLTASAQFTSIKKYKSYTGNVGLPVINADNSGKTYAEYRTPLYLTTDEHTSPTPCTADLEIGEGRGSGRFMWDSGVGQVTTNVLGKGQRADTSVPCILLKGSHASNILRNLRGDVGVAIYAGETAQYATLISGDGPTSQAFTTCGSGVTLAAVTCGGGVLETRSAVTTGIQNAGTWDHFTGTVTTLTVNGGTFRPRAALTITTGTVYGLIDLQYASGTVTFTNLVNINGEGHIYDPNGRAVFSAGYKLNSTKAKYTGKPGTTYTPS